MSAAAESLRVQPSVYDPVARAAHWLTVLLVAVEYIVGSVMPSIHWGTPLGALIKWHLALGSSLLLIVLFRVVWRLTHRPPPPPPMPAWQRHLAGVTHFLLYAALILMPLTGWASASARNWPVRAFGVLRLPALVPYRAHIGFRLGDVHADVIYWVLLGLITMHVGAALYHRVVKQDSILSRMLPERR